MSTTKSNNDNQNNYESTDMGNMNRFVDQYKDTIKSTGTPSSWFVWDGMRWKYCKDNTYATQKAYETIKNIETEALQTKDIMRKQELLRWSKQSQSNSKIQSMISMASKHEDLVVSMSDFDKDTSLINCMNGVVDLKSKTLLGIHKHRLISNLARVSYNPNAKAPTFINFINQVFGNDVELIRWVQRAIGYSLTGSVLEQKLFYAYGTGSNGKSTLFEIIMHILNDYSKATDFETFLSKQKSGVRELEAVGELKGVRYALASETDSHVRFSESTIKKLTGGDTLRGTRLTKSAFEFKPEFKLWFSANHLPYAKDGSFGFWRRIKIIPFTQTFSGSKVNSTLYEQLLQERDGIFKWCVDGAYHWYKELKKSGGKSGLGPCKAIDEATEEYKSENDVLGNFITECIETSPGSKVKARDLYDRYKLWNEFNSNGEFTNPISEVLFSRSMGERDLKKDRVQNNKVYLDIKLKNNGSCYNF